MNIEKLEVLERIAYALGKDWSVIKGNNDIQLSNNEIRLNIQDMDTQYSRANEKGKYCITYSYPRKYHEYVMYLRETERVKKIFVNKSKTPEQIKDDITRRILPHIKVIIDVCEKRIAQDQEASNRLIAAGQQYEALNIPELKVIYGEPDNSGSINGVSLSTSYQHDSTIIGKIYQSNFTLGYGTLTHPVALRLMKLIQLESEGCLESVLFPETET